jgi:hypothetical protein
LQDFWLARWIRLATNGLDQAINPVLIHFEAGSAVTVLS